MAMPEIRHKVIREPQETIARIESKVAEASRKAELAAATAKAAVEEDVTRRAEAYEKDRPAPAPKAGAAKEARRSRAARRRGSATGPGERRGEARPGA
jgi:hypothetical protein